MPAHTTYDTPLQTALEHVEPHDHLSLVYENEKDHYAVAIPFIQIGLDRGDKCVYIADDGSETAVRDAMHARNIDVEQAIAAGRLVLETKDGAFLKNGSFDPEWMPMFWKEATAEALRQGFSALRATGETEWVISGPPGIGAWMEYESRLTQVLEGLNCFALCQYNRQVLPPEFVLDVIRTHPTVIYRGVVCRNMYHVPPDELLGANRPALEAERLLTTIRERAELESTLRQQRNELQHSLEQLRSLAARLQRVREEERAGVAREIHDELGQALTGIKLESASLIRGLPGDAKEPLKRAQSIVKLADQTIQSVRRIATELRPGILDDLGIVAAVEWAAKEFEARTGTKCRADLPEDDIEADPEHATALFRILQEALTNVIRHSSATEVNVRLAREDGALTLEIQDNGKGISKEQLSAGKSLGILGMRERALMLGGELTVSGAPGKGVTVRVRIPEFPVQKPEQTPFLR